MRLILLTFQAPHRTLRVQFPALSLNRKWTLPGDYKNERNRINNPVVSGVVGGTVISVTGNSNAGQQKNREHVI
jgi:hypothetical protein